MMCGCESNYSIPSSRGVNHSFGIQFHIRFQFILQRADENDFFCAQPLDTCLLIHSPGMYGIKSVHFCCFAFHGGVSTEYLFHSVCIQICNQFVRCTDVALSRPFRFWLANSHGILCPHPELLFIRHTRASDNSLVIGKRVGWLE